MNSVLAYPLRPAVPGDPSKPNLDQASYEAFRTGYRRDLSASPPKRHLQDDSNSTTSWKTIEVGYFDGESERFCHIKNKDDILYFHHVVAFVSHLRALSVFRTEDTLRYNIHSCLRGKALEWFISELSQQDREALRTLPLEEGWFRALEQRFRPCTLAGEMLEADFDERAWMEDPLSSVSMAHCILRNIQVTKAGAHPVQWLRELWRNIPQFLHPKLLKPTQVTTILDFMSRLDLVGTQLEHDGGLFEEDECDVDVESD